MDLGAELNEIRSEMYDGACPLSALKTINNILNWILKETGSQWIDAKIGVIWSRFFAPVNNLDHLQTSQWRLG